MLPAGSTDLIQTPLLATVPERSIPLVNGRPHPDVVNLLQGTPLNIHILTPPKKNKTAWFEMIFQIKWTCYNPQKVQVWCLDKLSFSIGWFFSFHPLLIFRELLTVRFGPPKKYGKTRSFVPGAANSWPPSVRSFPSQWRGQNRCFWVNFLRGNGGFCSFVRIGMNSENLEKNTIYLKAQLKSLKLLDLLSNQNNWRCGNAALF